MTVLSVESVSKRYGDILALDDVSLSFPQGCITAVIGPSGCGKSTLLKLCNGLVTPDAGQASVFGRLCRCGRVGRAHHHGSQSQ